MNFSEIFWTTLKVRMAISIQDSILNSAQKAYTKVEVATNTQEILQELQEVGNSFNSLLAKHRNIIKIDKAILELKMLREFSFEEKEFIKTELLKLKINLESI